MIKIPTSELQFSFIRAPGPGGQNVNKLATAVELRWDVIGSPSLSEDRRARLISLAGKKITLGGELIIKASSFRTQERNKQDALDRLQTLLIRVATVQKKRKKTKPTFASKQQRLASKKIQSKVKNLRSKPKQED